MMTRRSVACLGLTALAVATLLLAAEPASAQRLFRRGSGYRYDRGYGYGDNYSGWGAPGSYGRTGWGAYPDYYGGSGYTPDYRWSNSEGYYSAPSYYSSGEMSGNFGTFSSTGGEFGYRAFDTSGMGNAVLITVRVPPNAEVWLDNHKTNQTGVIRQFMSPPLDSDHNFVYQIRAKWTENGRDIERTRKIEVHAGEQHVVNLMPRRAEDIRQRGTPSGRYGTEPDRSLENRDSSFEKPLP